MDATTAEFAALGQPWLIVVVLLSLATGWVLGQWWRAREIRRNRHRVRRVSKEILQDAERQGRARLMDAELQAKELLLQERREAQAEFERVREELQERERGLDKRQELVHEAERDLEARKNRMSQEEGVLVERERSLNAELRTLESRRESLAGLTPQQARQEIIEEVQGAARAQAIAAAERDVERAKADAGREVRRILTLGIERIARDIISERSCSFIAVPSEEMRGRIIGRDGRNVRAFEAITGVDLLLDEVPGQVILSCHDPLRRDTAKVTLERLMADGRIQPSRIEEFYRTVQAELPERVVQLGRGACDDALVSGVPTEVLAVLGKLAFRTSYSQNVLRHVVEATSIAALIAAEIGFDAGEVSKLRRATLFHDIGKALDEQHVGPHALVGAEFMRRHGEAGDVVNAIAAHHGEVPEESLLAPIVKAADALSGARPGARRQDLEAYVRRLEQMEGIAKGFPGVERAYAFQAGRELHVMIAAGAVSEAESAILAHAIAKRIEQEVRSMGEVRIAVIRETRSVGYARWS